MDAFYQMTWTTHEGRVGQVRQRQMATNKLNFEPRPENPPLTKTNTCKPRVRKRFSTSFVTQLANKKPHISKTLLVLVCNCTSWTSVYLSACRLFMWVYAWARCFTTSKGFLTASDTWQTWIMLIKKKTDTVYVC